MDTIISTQISLSHTNFLPDIPIALHLISSYSSLGYTCFYQESISSQISLKSVYFFPAVWLVSSQDSPSSTFLPRHSHMP